jgi:hypothetical protein
MLKMKSEMVPYVVISDNVQNFIWNDINITEVREEILQAISVNKVQKT